MELNRNNKTRPNPWLCAYSNLVLFDTHLLNTKFFFYCVCVWQFLAYLFCNNCALSVSSPLLCRHDGHHISTKRIQNRFRNSSEQIRALAFTANFISLISLSISSIKWMTKSTNLCLYICSVWKFVIRKLMSYPSIGLRRNTTKFSARIIMKRVNLWQRIFSISSACLTAMLTRTELTLVSIRTRSFSFRDITTGFSSNSLLLRTSTSGLLCRSTTCDEKLVKHIDAVNVCRTAVKYGFSVAAIWLDVCGAAVNLVVVVTQFFFWER